MDIFRKNKRQFGIHSYRRVFVALFLVIVIGMISSFFLNVNAQLSPIHSVTFSSEHLDFGNSEEGSWNITKTAEWVGETRAKVTFTAESITKTDKTKKLDIILVIDNSGSMEGDKLNQVKADSMDLINTLLSASGHRISLVAFNTNAQILSDFTDDRSLLSHYVNSLGATGNTNYYEGLLRAEELLVGYEQSSDRELILLFLTDGYPNNSTPNEIAEYQILKTAYPYMTVNGIQYEMGDEILQPIVDISDYQYIATMDSLNNVLFEATACPYFYNELFIKDYIDDTYWEFAGADSIGIINDSDQSIEWDLSGKYRTGQTATLSFEVELKDDYREIGDDSLLFPSNTHEIIRSKLSDSPDEYIDSTLTPILKSSYEVSYDDNAPSECDVSGIVPATEMHKIYTSVPISDNQLTCEGYVFRGWQISTPNVVTINNDYFRMPGGDVVMRAIWSKLSISKHLEGTIHLRSAAIFDLGQTVNAKMKKLAGQASATYSTSNSNITAFVKFNNLPATVDTNDDQYILSSPDSEIPIYGWFADGTLYYYSDAEDIYLNVNAGSMFNSFTSLTDISGLESVNTSRTTSLSNMFYNAKAITNIDSLRNWDTSKVTNMISLFNGASSLANIDGMSGWSTASLTGFSSVFRLTKITNVDALSNWDTSKVTDFQYLFYSAKQLVNIDGLRNWDTSKVRNMQSTFSYTAIEYINALTNWDTSSVIYMTSMFAFTPLWDIDGAINWDTSNVQKMSFMFDNCLLENIDGAINWDTSNVTDMSGMFRYANWLLNIDGAANWKTNKVTDMREMFHAAAKLTNVNGALNWDTSNVTDMHEMFSEDSQLTNNSGLTNWKTGNVTNMKEMFRNNNKITSVTALTNWDVSKVTNLNGMFYSNLRLSSIAPLSGWNTSNVTNMAYLFFGTRISTVAPLANWNTEKVTNMAYLFGCDEYLSNISGLTNWKTGNVTDMSYLLYQTNISNIDALSDWNTSKVTNMWGMFLQAKNLKNLNGASSWDTSNVTTMRRMFEDATTLSDISGISGWDVSSVTNMADMFKNAGAITDLVTPLGGWTTTSLTDVTDTFTGIPDTITRPTWYILLAQ